MPKRDRLISRNAKVRKYFADLERKNPQWKLEAIIKETANNFDLSNRTISAIIKFEGTYKN